MTRRPARFSPLAVGVVCSMVTGAAGAALYGFGPAESWTIQEIAALSASVSSNIGLFGTTFAANMSTKFEQVISSIAVATKQEALAAGVVSDSIKDSAEQLVNAARAQRQNDQVAAAILSYNPSTGQGYQPCLVTAANRTLDGAFDSLGATARSTVAGLDVAPGRLVDSTGAAMQRRLQEHRAKFCTPSEADAGMCRTSELPGGDTNGALLFEPAQAGSLKAQARQSFVQHVLGPPDERVTPDAGRTLAGQQYMVAKNTKDALVSIPAYSFAMVEAANTQSSAFGGKSPNEVLRLRVNQYFGGQEAQRWSGTLTAQSERGLMVEAVKMAGLEVWLHHKQYQQNQRLELNLAALALAASEDARAVVDQKYQRVRQDLVARDIK